MSSQSWTMSELLDRMTQAISQTRDRLDNKALEDVLMQLEDIEARLKAREALDDDYRKSISFNVIAVRELEDTDDTHAPYLDLLSQLASHLVNTPQL